MSSENATESRQAGRFRSSFFVRITTDTGCRGAPLGMGDKRYHVIGPGRGGGRPTPEDDVRPGGPMTAGAETPTQIPEDLDAFAAARVSAWSFREKAVRAVWMVVRAALFRTSWHNWYAYRRWLLRLFGAKLGRR